MSILVECSSCGRRFQAPPQFAGKRVKCKHCGTTFQVKAVDSEEGGDDPETDLLTHLEKTGIGAAVEPSPNFATPGRIGPKNEKRLQANPDAEDIPLGGGGAVSSARANFMHFRYPGAKAVDQWLPLGLLVLSFAVFAAIVSGQDTHGVTWIRLLRFAIPVLFYYSIIFPITLGMLRKAGSQLGYRPPPNSKLRTFAIYAPAFVAAAGFWLAGDGALMGLVLGGFVGLAVSSGALWLLYRLHEDELATSVSFGIGGFLLGAAITIGLMLGLNLLTESIVAHAQGAAKVPASPFGPGLAWIAPPPPPDTTPPKPAAVAVAAPPQPVDLTPESPIVTDVAMDKISDPISAVVRPLSDIPIIAIVHAGANNAATVETWDTSTWSKVGTDLVLSSSLGQYALSVDGQQLAYVDHFPKLSAKIWSFASGSIVKRVDLSGNVGEPKLIGFSAANRLVIRWVKEEPVAGAAATPQPWSIAVINTEKQEPVTAFETPAVEPGEAAVTVNQATQRMAVATKVANSPVLMQYDLSAKGDPSVFPINEIDSKISVVPTGLAYTRDGKRITILFEYGGGAVMPTFDAQTGAEIKDLEYPAWPPAGVSTTGYTGNALAWLDSPDLLLVYGQSVIDTSTSKPLTSLMIPGVVDQRVLSGNRVELMVDRGGAKHVVIATLDPSKVKVTAGTTQP